jgi:signal transduction histidine kinase
MDQSLLAPLFWCLLACAAVGAVLLARQRHVTTRLRVRNAEVEQALRIREEEVAHLASVRLRAVVDSVNGIGVDVPGLLHPRLQDTTFAQDLQVVLDLVADSEAKAVGRADEWVKTSLQSMARAVQSLAAEQQIAISAMQEQHDDPLVLEGLLRIDHANSQLGRRVQAVAVLCGAWPGTQRTAAELVDVVRGAVSRIRDYLRVEVRSRVDLAVVDTAVEPVVLAVAELLDNAARSSQSGTTVRVDVQGGHNGVSIVIDDAGVGMNSELIAKAHRLLSGTEPVDVRRLGNPPQTGFAVCGVLVAKYGFRVSVDTTSPYGGVRAVVFLPNDLLTRVERPEPLRSPPRATPVAAPPLEDHGQRPTTLNGLPVRRRQRPVQAGVSVSPRSRPAELQVAPPRSPEQTASGIGAWQQASVAGRAIDPHDERTSP